MKKKKKQQFTINVQEIYIQIVHYTATKHTLYS